MFENRSSIYSGVFILENALSLPPNNVSSPCHEKSIQSLINVITHCVRSDVLTTFFYVQPTYVNADKSRNKERVVPYRLRPEKIKRGRRD